MVTGIAVIDLLLCYIMFVSSLHLYWLIFSPTDISCPIIRWHSSFDYVRYAIAFYAAETSLETRIWIKIFCRYEHQDKFLMFAYVSLRSLKYLFMGTQRSLILHHTLMPNIMTNRKMWSRTYFLNYDSNNFGPLRPKMNVETTVLLQSFNFF